MNLGRNHLCPCGSGRKFKKCCGSNGNVPATKNKKSTQSKSENDELVLTFLRMGNACAIAGKLQLAIIHFENALSINRKCVECYIKLANVLLAVSDHGRAIDYLNKALLIKSEAKTYFDLANVYEAIGEIDQAVMNYKNALVINPNYAEAHNNLGNQIKRSHGLLQATHHYQQAIKLKPDLYVAYNNLALALLEQGEVSEAIANFKSALTINPKFLQAHDNLLYTLNYMELDELTISYAAHVEFGKLVEVKLQPIVNASTNEGVHNDRLRIGYVSSDLRQHSVSRFIEPVLENHDRSRFEVYCYSNTISEDEVTALLKSRVEHWRNIGSLSDSDVVKQIKADRIDILVDLNGHTQNNRLLVFARKPAPIQVTWLGYPNTTGLSAIDYRFTDSYADPVGETEHLHTETLIRLPESFCCYKPPRDAPQVSSLPALEKGYITFGSFNKLAKINRAVMEAWAAILLAAPDSRLLLKTSAFVEKEMRSHIFSVFEALGVSPTRLDLKGTDQAQRTHLEQYNAVDIGLDPFPYNGTTTTCEALWMGVPIVTLAGCTHVGRVGVSQMSNLGLTELISHSKDEYIATAVRLSSNLKGLETLRNGLRQRMAVSPLMCARPFTEQLEQIYLGIADVDVTTLFPGFIK